MTFVATQIDLEIVILSEVSQEKKDKYLVISLIHGIQNMTQMNLQNRNILMGIENKYTVTKVEREGRDKLGVSDQQIQTTNYKIHKQQGPTVKRRELYSISYNKL